ncbi:MAG: aminoglycoside phosphotransferase family protein [Acetobacter sp.]|nr:aminoglycoside phosphotransferase family protein [Acetobacter sp.]
MAKLISKNKAKQFHTFLQTYIFNGSLKSFRSFRGGNSSYCFFATTETENWVAKILLGEYIPSKIHTYLATQTSKHPVLCGIKMDKIFEYEGKTCTLQKNYGKPLPRRYFSTELIKQIFTEYRAITHLSTKYQSVDKEYNPRHKIELYQQTLQILSTQKNWHSKLLLHLLLKINPETLIFKKENLCIIHGDFNNNQVLLKEGKLSAFIDWDSLRTGYPTEDCWEFIYFNLRHLYNPLMYNYWRRRIVSQVTSVMKYSYEEWQTAINSMLISWLYRLSQPKEYKLKRLIKFLYLYYISTKTLKQIKKQS